MSVPEIFVDLDSVVFIQEEGPGSEYAAMPCHSIDGAGIGRSEAVRIYCKSASVKGERVLARTVKGVKTPGTLTINARSQQQSDLLHRIFQRNCLFGAQTHLDVCGLPTDVRAYTKTLDYYGITPGNLEYSNVDNIEGGTGAALNLALACIYDDLIEVLKCTLTRIAAAEITVLAHITDIHGDLTERCASDCGTDRRRCEIIFAVTGFLAGPAISQGWYSTDSGVNWAATGVAPFAADAATVDIGACAVVGDRWLAFLGAAFAGLAGRCSYTDDHGATWVAVDMGGTANDDYTTRAFVFDAGNIFVCGGANVAPSGHVWTSHDIGDTWDFAEDINTQILRDIHTADGDTIYAVGDANTVRKSTDGGTTWATLAGPASGVGFDLLAVRALTNDHVIIGGEIDANSEQLWQSFDGGLTWEAIPFQGSTTAATQVWSLSLAPHAPIQHLWMIHGASGAVVNYAFRSLDGGASFERWTPLDNDGYRRVYACDSNNAWIAGRTDALQGATGTVVHAHPVS